MEKKNTIKFTHKRKGDAPKLFCSIRKAKKTLNWKPYYSDIIRIIKDEINWNNYLAKKNIYR